ncbi:asr1064 [Nostoc sp. PCC 7120 = FACHB-418]|nr:asr1064 [Nostoc sp. PCC 7120 = FACHB-418]
MAEEIEDENVRKNILRLMCIKDENPTFIVVETLHCKVSTALSLKFDSGVESLTHSHSSHAKSKILA